MTREKNKQLRASSKNEFQDIVLSTMTDNMILKTTIDNVTQSDCRYSIQSLAKTEVVNVTKYENTRLIHTKNSKKNGLNIEANFSDAIELDRQSNLTNALYSKLGLKIETVKLIEVDRKSGEVFKVENYTKDMQISKHFVSYVFKEIPEGNGKLNEGYTHVKLVLRYNTLDANSLNFMKPNSNYLDIYMIDSITLEQISTKGRDGKLNLGRYCLFYVSDLDIWAFSNKKKIVNSETNTEVIATTFEPLSDTNIDTYISNLTRNNRNYYVSYSKFFDRLNKQYAEKIENKKLANKRKEVSTHG